MKRKKLSVIVGGALIFGLLAGCNSGSSEPTDAEPDAVEETASEETPLVVYGDTINSEGCVVASRFKHGDKIVFRATAIDGYTKEQLQDAEIKVILNGEELPMRLGPHGEKETMFWTAAYVVPDDAPTGTLDFKYVATIDGVEAEYTQFDVTPSLLTIVADEEKSEEAGEEEATEEEAADEENS